jgi:exosortase
MVMMRRQLLKRQKVKAVILAGNRDFTMCPLARRLPTALWPVSGRPALERMLTSLADQGLRQVTICSAGDSSLLADSIHVDNRLELKFLDEPLPVGTAGCIRGAADNETDAVFIVFPATIISPPKIDVLLQAHRDGGADLTVMLNPNQENSQLTGQGSCIYVCNPAILQHVPKEGYFDIKEGLIREMIRVGKTVHTVTLPKPAGNFRDRQSYLNAIANYLENGPGADTGLNLCKRTDSQTAWMADNVSIHPSVRICGPVAIMDGAQISKDVVIVGPAIIERGVTIGQGSVVVNSALWDEATIGPNCQIQRCLIDYHAVVPANTIVEEESIMFKAPGILQCAGKAFMAVKNTTSKLRITSPPQLAGINAKLPAWVDGHKAQLIPGLAMGVVLVALLWSYWGGVVELWQMWQRSDEYSSGLLVPFLAVYILWSRHNDLAQCRIRPSLWGILFFVGAQAVRLSGLALIYSSAENLSIALSVAALVLLLFGWPLLRRVSTVLLFLCLMLPWPNRIQAAIALPLQEWATSSAVFCLETMGYSVMQEGNVIHIGSASVAVAEACNGLRMVTAFFVISGLVVLLVKRTWWEKLIVFASSLPVALLCNTTRLAITALAFTVVSGEYWEKVFHDFGGYAMMPLALATVVAELWILAKLTMPPTQKEAIIAVRRK